MRLLVKISVSVRTASPWLDKIQTVMIIWSQVGSSSVDTVSLFSELKSLTLCKFLHEPASHFSSSLRHGCRRCLHWMALRRLRCLEPRHCVSGDLFLNRIGSKLTKLLYREHFRIVSTLKNCAKNCNLYRGSCTDSQALLSSKAAVVFVSNRSAAEGSRWQHCARFLSLRKSCILGSNDQIKLIKVNFSSWLTWSFWKIPRGTPVIQYHCQFLRWKLEKYWPMCANTIATLFCSKYSASHSCLSDQQFVSNSKFRLFVMPVSADLLVPRILSI